MPILLKNQTSAQLHATLAHAGVSPHLARRLLAASVRRGELPTPGSDLTTRLRDDLLALTEIPHLTQVQKVVSPQDGFTKYLFQGQGLGQFEAIRIPLLHRPDDLKYVACVSSQVGCGMGCVFCATGRMGFGRNLAAWEIVDQVVKMQADSPHPIRGVVFMGSHFMLLRRMWTLAPNQPRLNRTTSTSDRGMRISFMPLLNKSTTVSLTTNSSTSSEGLALANPLPSAKPAKRSGTVKGSVIDWSGICLPFYTPAAGRPTPAPTC
jgi:hypothetical protein